MLDLPRLDRLRLSRYPLSQRFFGRLLQVNYGCLPGVSIELEDAERIPEAPAIFAMNHTDRYNYFPFQYTIWRRYDRFTATWVKGKYYENALLALFMESMLQLPTVSRGYLITKDFQAVLGRTPTDQEYALLREAVDARAVGEAGTLPEPPLVPELLFRKARNPLGLPFDPTDPGRGDWADYICGLFQAMMARFVALNEEAVRIGLDLLIFPQGTRSVRLLPGHPGIAQIALHLKRPIVPVGCNGSDHVYPGGSPFGRRGRIVYRVGAPIPYEELSPFHVETDFAPFTAQAERDHAERFRGVADLVTERIDALLDPEYRLDRGGEGEAFGRRSTERFL
jgi:1-acyl-sn-glycerol-3-phosphate acyltransferase